MGRITVAQVVGESTSKVWSQVGVFGVGSEAKQQGEMVLALTVRSKGGDDAGDSGRGFLGGLEQAVREVSGTLGIQSWSELIQGKAQELPGLSCLVAVWFNEGMTGILGWGETAVVWKRDKKVGTIYQGKLGEWSMMQGKVEMGDRILVGTWGLVGEMSEALIGEILGFDEVSQAGEELMTQVYAAAENSNVAGVIVHVGENLAEPIEPEPEHEGNPPNPADSEPAIYLKMPSKRRKTAISVGVVLLLLLGMSILFGWQRRQIQLKDEFLSQTQASAQELLTQAQPLTETDPQRATELAQQAVAAVKNGMAQADKIKGQEEKWEQLLSSITSQAASVSGEQSVDSIPVWFEASLIREQMVGQKIVVDSGRLFILDGQLGVVGQVTVQDKQAEVVGGGDLVRGATLMGIAGNRLVAYTPQGIVELNVSRKTSGMLVKPEAEWQRVAGVGLFSGNVYVLDAGANEIWQYPGLSEGVGARKRWLGAGVTADFSGAVDMAIDGDIWVGIKNGEVLRFRRSQKEAFSIKGLPDPIGELAAVEVDQEGDKVYLLDRGKTRIVVVTKDGVFVKQYRWKGISGVTDIAVDETAQILFLVSGSSVYSMNL